MNQLRQIFFAGLGVLASWRETVLAKSQSRKAPQRSLPWLAFILLCVLCGKSSAQTAARYAITGSGAPAGACVVTGSGYAQIYINRTNGDWYVCTGALGTTSGTWILAGNHSAGTGNVVGPASSTNNAVALFDGTTGKLLKNSAITFDGTTLDASTFRVKAGEFDSDQANIANNGTIRFNKLDFIGWRNELNSGNVILSKDTSDRVASSGGFDAGANSIAATQSQGNNSTKLANTAYVDTLGATKQATGNYITALTGDGAASGPGSVALTLATVNGNVGSFGSATQSLTITANAKGLITAISTQTVTPAVGSITGLGTGVATALGVNVGSAGAFVVNGGALGTPSSGNGSNLTGITATQVGLGNVTNDAQTKAAIVPNTAPSAGQILVGNAGGTAYAPVTPSGSGATISLSSLGVFTISAIPSATLNLTTTTCTNQFVTAISSGGVGTCTTDTLASAQHANQGTTTTVLHGNAAGNPSFAAVSMTADITGTLPVGNGGSGSASAPSSGQILVGNAGGTAYAPVTPSGSGATITLSNAGVFTISAIPSATLNLTTTTCTNQFVTAISSGGVGTCTTDTLASAQHANQGTTTTVLHGNAAGNPSFAAVGINDVSGSTGTVNFVFSTSPNITTPTFTTSATGPLFIGGTAAGSSLELRSTSGTGSSDFVNATVGTNGGTEVWRALTSGSMGIGSTTISNVNERLQVKARSGVTWGASVVTNDFNSGTNTGSGLFIGFGASSGNTYTTLQAVSAGTSGSAALYIQGAGNVKIAGTVSRATTEGTNHLDIFDGTAPVGTLANGISLYSTAGELRVMDAAGNATLLSPHDHATNEWIFYSKNTVTGREVRIDAERMLRYLNAKFGTDFVHDSSSLNGEMLRPDLNRNTVSVNTTVAPMPSNIGGTQVLTPTPGATITLAINATAKHIVASWTSGEAETINVSGTPQDGTMLTLIITNDGILGRLLTPGTGLSALTTILNVVSKKSTVSFVALNGVFYEVSRTVGL